MTTFLIDNIKRTLPECWDDVTYSQYVALLSMPANLVEYISLFTGLSKKELLRAEMPVEAIAQTLSFLNVAPTFAPKPSPRVGPYKVQDTFVKILGQFAALQELLKKAPSPVVTIEDNERIADLYLEACAVMATKSKYGKYSSDKVQEVKQELKNYSSVEIIQTGGFYLFQTLKRLQPHQVN